MTDAVKKNSLKRTDARTAEPKALTSSDAAVIMLPNVKIIKSDVCTRNYFVPHAPRICYLYIYGFLHVTLKLFKCDVGHTYR